MSATFISYRQGDADYTTHTLHPLTDASQSGQQQVVEVITIGGVTYAMVIDAGTSATNGLNGWTPVLGLYVDGDRTLARVTDWVGGGGTKPAAGMFLGASGFVSDLAQAISVRGPKGEPGDIAQLADGAIGKAKLAPSVQDSLNKADSAVQDLDGIVAKVAAGTAEKRAELQGLVSGEWAPSGQAQYLRYRLDNGLGHCSILICSDSTGAIPPGGAYPALDYSVARWPAILAKWAAEQWPAYTVRLRMWDDVALDYSAPIQINAGTGPYNLDIFNFAVSGTRPEYMMAKRYAKGVQAITDTGLYTSISPELHLYILNHGHNLTGLGTGSDVIRDVAVLQYAQNVEQVLIDHPRAGVIIIGQNPELTTTDNDLKWEAARLYAGKRGFGFADVWTEFVSRGRDPSLYVTTDALGDVKHPSAGEGSASAPTGTRLFADAVFRHIKYPSHSERDGNLSELSLSAINLLTNGNFANWATNPGAPDGWTLAGGSCEQDSTIFESFLGRSVKLTSAGAACHLSQNLTAAQLAAAKGKWLTLAVRLRVPEGESSGTVGRIGLLSSSASTNNSIGFLNRDGGWMWLFVSLLVKSADTYVRARLYCDSSATTGKICNFDRAVLVLGTAPRDSR